MKTKTFLCEYEYEGFNWSIEIEAESWEDAERRLKRIGKGRIAGEAIAVIPLPFFGWAGKFLDWIKNTSF